MSSVHDDLSTWTAGAQRVWRAAHDLASVRNAEAVAVEHLLWGLLCEENRAAERLSRAGVSPRTFQERWGNVKESSLDHERGDVSLPRHELLETVLIEARTEAFREGAGTELGTEHLLVALCEVPSAVSDWLSGFDWNERTEKTSPPSPAEAPELSAQVQVAPEFELTWHDATSTDLIETYRILDAGANRAREGLRVVEDFVRWAWNEGFLSQQLKDCRHELTAILRQLPQPILISARDTEQDVGTEIRTASEYRRESPADVATASLKRVEEALRSLEEFSKVVDAELSPRLEKLRYRIYTLEKALQTTRAARLQLANQSVCLLATTSLCHHGLGPAIRGALDGGVRMIQLREKNLSDRELLELAGYVRDWTNEFEALLIVNDRADIAAIAGADGVHLGQEDLSVAEARKILGPGKLIGVSTHSIAQARQAVLDGADYLGVGPVFPSSTKSFDEFPGLNFVREVAAEISLPWFAIGGITSDRLPELQAAGALRVAVSSAICSAEEPVWAAGVLVQRLKPSP